VGAYGAVLVFMDDPGSNGGVAWGLGLAMVMCLYIVPTFCAFYLGHPNKWMILLVNVFGGETVFLWFACLFWALSDYVVGGTPTVNVVHSEPPSPLGAASDHVSQLERLAEMWTAGHITDDEYSAAKQRLLGA
jgi:hypothetical protein